MRTNDYKKGERGIGLIEVVVASGIIALITVGIARGYQLLISSSRNVVEIVQAEFLIEEGLEATRLMRDANWNTIDALNPGTSYTLVFDGAAWSATTTPSLIEDRFDRRLMVSPVYRDANDDIAESGTLDDGTKLIEVEVSWTTARATSTRSGVTYLTDIF